MKRNARQRLLDLVLARVGGKQAAERLEVDARTLDDWARGASPIPDDKLVRLVDLIDQTSDG